MKTTQSQLLVSLSVIGTTSLLMLACNSNSNAPARVSGPQPGATPPAGPVTVQSIASAAGEYLTDANGHSVYVFLADTAGQSNCNEDCAEAWPPVTVEAGQTPVAGGTAVQALVGKIQRADGKTQVTYKDQPLYRFSGDTEPGQFNGQGITAFGAEWYLVKIDGSSLQEGDPTQPEPQTSPSPEPSASPSPDVSALLQ